MRVVFFGTPLFSATILQYLIEKEVQLVAVVTKPDKPQGRSLKITPSPVKEVALQHGISLYQPPKAKDPSFLPLLKELQPDLFVVAAYSEIFNQELLSIPRVDSINVHPSLLPKYRGAAPIERAVMAGETKTAVTIMSMKVELDAGDILKVEEVDIPLDMTSGELRIRLAEVGKELLWQVLQEFDQNAVKRVRQDPSQVSYAAKITSQDQRIDWNEEALTVHNRIRGLTPHPGAWCAVKIKGETKRLIIKKTLPESSLQGPPGQILPDKGLVIGCKKGALRLLEVQLEGKKAVSVEQFLRGYDKEKIEFEIANSN